MGGKTLNFERGTLNVEGLRLVERRGTTNGTQRRGGELEGAFLDRMMRLDKMRGAASRRDYRMGERDGWKPSLVRCEASRSSEVRDLGHLEPCSG
jgi:hypothetical protein